MYEAPDGSISFFFILDDGDGSGGNANVDFECMPLGTQILFVDDPAGSGSPDAVTGTAPSFSGTWGWGPPNTDGVVFGNLGCGFTVDIYPNNLGGINTIEFVTGDLAMPTIVAFPSLTEKIRIDCGGGACCPADFDTNLNTTDVTCPGDMDGTATVTPNRGTPPFIFQWSDGQMGQTATGLAEGEYSVTITDAEGCTDVIFPVIIGTQFQIPIANSPAPLEACGDAAGFGTFNLAMANGDIGNGQVFWYEDEDLTTPIVNIGAFVAMGGTTVWVVLSNGFCDSEPVPVVLNTLIPPSANPVQYDPPECELTAGSGEAIFDLNQLIQGIITEFGDQVTFYTDPGGNNPIADPGNFFATDGTFIYYSVSDGTCESDIMSTELVVAPLPTANAPTDPPVLCDEGNNQATFDLTIFENEISGGVMMTEVTFYLDPNGTIPITNPGSFTAGTITVYAQVSNDLCASFPLTPIQLTVSPVPTGQLTPQTVCGDENGEFSFDLTQFDADLGAPAVAVNWFEDQNLNNLILDPTNYTTPSTSVFAVIDNSFCASQPIELELTVNPTPVAISDTLTVCADTLNQFTIDLTLLDSTINDSTNFTVIWYLDSMLNDEIMNTNSFTTTTDTLFAVVDNGPCVSEPVPVLLNVDELPTADATATSLCEESNDEATFDLTMLNGNVNVSGNITWYTDEGLTNPIADPQNFLTPSTTVYAVANDGLCSSFPAPVDLTVLQLPEPLTASDALCEEANDEATFNLNNLENTILNGGSGTVQWYTDDMATQTIGTPGSFTTGTITVYATVDNGDCVSGTVEVDLTVNLLPEANPDQIAICDEGNSSAIFDLTTLEGDITGGAAGVTVIWSENADGTNPIANPGAYTSGDNVVFAVVDDGTCTSEAVPVTIGILDTPVASSTSQDLCEEANDQATFDLTSLDGAVFTGTGTINWYQDANGTTPIGNPSAILTGTTTVFAQVDNGACTSEIVPVDLTVLQLPEPVATNDELCEISNDQATFDLTTLEGTIGSAQGTVQWYLDENATQAIGTPNAFQTGTVTVFANIDNGDCVSGTVPVTLTVNLLPDANPDQIAICDEGNNSAIFDLTTLENDISNGVGTVNWYEDGNTTMSIANPGAFTSGDNIVFATVDDGTCVSNPVAVQISILETPVAVSTSETLCEDVNDQATFDLTTLEGDIYTGVGGVVWYEDANGTMPIADPTSLTTAGTTVFAQADNTACTSEIVPIDLNVNLLPETTPASQALCEEANAEATFDLLTLAQTVSGGIGTVTWYTDAAATQPLGLNVAFPSTTTTIYATVDDGNCVSPPQAVDLTVMLLPEVNPLTIEDCDDGSGGASLVLDDFSLAINPAGEQVLWFEDDQMQMPITNTGAFFTGPTTIFALVDDQMCQSALVPVDIDITVSTAPTIECIFTSIDSVHFEWDMVGIEYEVSYTVNGMNQIGPFTTTDNFIGIGGLVEGDIASVTVGVIVDPDCPPVQFATSDCEADSCPINPIEFNNLNATYCNNEPPFVVDATPIPGTLVIDGVTTNTFDASQYSGDVELFYTYIDPVTTCEYVDSFTITVVEALLQPTLECVDPTTQTLTFNWSDVGAIGYEVTYSVNNGAPITFTTTDLTFLLEGLSDENDVTLSVLPLGDAPCGNGPSVETSCSTLPCPPAGLAIDFLDPSYCSDGPIVGLPNIYPGGIYGGDGVTGTDFDPTQVMGAMATINFTYTDTLTGCTYTIEGTTDIIQPLDAPTVSCTDMTDVSVTFTWDATSDIGEYTYEYTVNGMNPVSGNTTQNTLEVTGIFPEDIVQITVIALGSQPCGESEPATGECSALPCPDQTINISGLDAEYCEDGASATLSATPVGGTFSGPGMTGDVFNPADAGPGVHTIYYNYTNPQNMCDYVDSVLTEVFEPLATPVITCGDATTQSVSFSWTDVGVATYEVTYSINGQTPTVQLIIANELSIPNLNPEDVVDITVTAIGTPPCGNSETATQTCNALPCPVVTFDLTDPGLICSTDDVIQLDLVINNQSTMTPVVWSGDGIISTDGQFDPAQANIGMNSVTVSLSEIGCDYDTTFMIEVLPTPVAAFTAGNLICSDSTLTINYEGTATADANIIWGLEGGMVVSGQTDGQFEVMWDTPGTYTISLMIDDEGCTSQTITQQVDVVGPLVAPTINCENVGFTTLVFSWDPVANADEYQVVSSTGTGTLNGTTFTIDNLMPGEEVSIEVTSIGDTPCGPVVSEMMCSTPECPDVNITYNTTPVICQGDDVIINLEITGGPANETYTLNYLLNGNAQSATIQDNDILTFSNVQADLSFEVVDFFGNSFVVCNYTNPDVLDVAVNTPPVAGTALEAFQQCQGENNSVGLADLLTGADATGTWSYTGGALGGFNAAAGTLNTAALAPGQYDFEYFVSGQGICPDDAQIVSVLINPNPVADAGIEQLIDCKDPTATLSSSNTGVTYQWSGPNIIGADNQANIEVGAAGIYTLTVINEFGCEATDQVEVFENLNEPQPFISFQDISCFGVEDGVITIDSITGGVPPYEVSLNGQNIASLVNLDAGEYTIQVTGANGCATTEIITLVEPEELVVDIEADLNAQNLITFGDSVLLEAFYQPTNRPIDTIVWNPNITGGLNTFVSPEIQTTYTVTVIDENGCLAMDDITIFVERVRPVFIPNVFSPNEDGNNDIFYIQAGPQVTQIKSFYIYSRWGESLFEVQNFQPNDPAFGWDGTHRGREVNTGVYVFMAEVEFNDGQVLIYKGDVTLMR